MAVAELVALYAQNGPVIARDINAIGPIKGFPHQWRPEDIEAPEPLPHPKEFL